jgi:hypothetical protein
VSTVPLLQNRIQIIKLKSKICVTHLKVISDEFVHDADASDVVAVDLDLLGHALQREQRLPLFRRQSLEKIKL